MALNYLQGLVENRLPVRVERLDRHTMAIVRQGMEREGEFLERELKEELDSQGHNVSGDLRKSVNHEVWASASSRQAYVSVGPGTEYGPAHELGSKPHWAPIEPLIAWVRNRGLTGRWSVTTRRRLGSRKSQFNEDFALARRIQFKIAHHGTKAHPFVGPVFDRERGRAVTRLNDWVAAELKRRDT